MYQVLARDFYFCADLRTEFLLLKFLLTKTYALHLVKKSDIMTQCVTTFGFEQEDIITSDIFWPHKDEQSMAQLLSNRNISALHLF